MQLSGEGKMCSVNVFGLTLCVRVGVTLNLTVRETSCDFDFSCKCVNVTLT